MGLLTCGHNQIWSRKRITLASVNNRSEEARIGIGGSHTWLIQRNNGKEALIPDEFVVFIEKRGGKAQDNTMWFENYVN